MASSDPSSRNIANNNFGNNVTIYQGNIHPVAGQTDQCLADLRSTDPRDDKTRIQQTKGGLLKDSYYWITQNETFKQWREKDQSRMLWIKGDPGKGKTMLLCGIIDELLPETKLAKPLGQASKTFLAYFFCQGTDARLNTATAVLRGLIYLIIIQEPSLISHVQKKYSHAGKNLFQDKNAWVSVLDILQNIIHDPNLKEIVFVIDALDECETDSPQLLHFIIQNASLPHVKWLLSSRNILSIQQKLGSHILQGMLSLELKANAESVSRAVDTYIEHSITHIYSLQHNQNQRDELRDAMRQKANGTFLWASLVMRELEYAQSWELMEIVMEMPMDLTAVYKRMLGQIRRLRRGNPERCWSILSTIFTAYYPLSVAELGILSGLPSDISENIESISNLVAMCGSFLTIREGTIYFIHQSAKDFLSAEVFHSNAAQRDADIYKHSIAAISKLRQNIYHLTDFGFRPKDAPPPDPNPLASMRYCCFFWSDHFCNAYDANPQPKSTFRKRLEDTLWSFLKDYVLRWLESICLLGGLPDGLRSIQKILRELQLKESPQLLKLLRSIEKFIISNGSIIDRAPLQIYGSALVLSQSSSDIKQQQWKDRLPFIENMQGTINPDNALLQTLEIHDRTVSAISFSLNGSTVASGCVGGTIKVWDAATGATQHTVTSHAYSIIGAISLSPDCKTLRFVEWANCQTRLVSVSIDGKGPGACIHYGTIQLNGEPAYGMPPFGAHIPASFSLDGKTLALTVDNGPMELWDAAAGERLRVFQSTFFEGIGCIAFSPDSETIASGHENGMVRLRQAETGVCFREFHPGDWVYACAFQPDGRKLALAGRFRGSRAALLMDLATGKCHETPIGQDSSIDAIAFSPDSKMIALASNSSIRLWDAQLITLEQRLEEARVGDSTEDARVGDSIEKMAFSPDGKILASTYSNSDTIQLWDVATGTRWQAFQSPSHWPTAIVFSPNGGTLALGGHDIWLWDIATGWHTCQHEGLAGAQAADAQALDAQLVDAQLVDAQTRLLPALQSRKRLMMDNKCKAIAFSPDGRKLAYFLEEYEIQLQDIATGDIQMRFEDNEAHPTAITFSPDGKELSAVYIQKYPHATVVRVWDVATGACLRSFNSGLKKKSVKCPSIRFLPGGQLLCINNRCIKSWLQPEAEPPEHDLLLVVGDWIMRGGKHVLWLPREYRTGMMAVHDNVVAIGHKSDVIFISFNF